MYFLVGETGIVGVAWAMLAANCISLPVTVVMASKHVPFGLGAFLNRMWRSLLAGAAMYFAVREFLLVDLNLPDILILFLAVIVGALVYATALFLLIRVFGSRSNEEWKLVKNAVTLVAQKVQFSN